MTHITPIHPVSLTDTSTRNQSVQSNIKVSLLDLNRTNYWCNLYIDCAFLIKKIKILESKKDTVYLRLIKIE